jgi:hypothetical protein
MRVGDRPCCIGHITSATVRLTDRPCASLCLWLLLHPLYEAMSPTHHRLTRLAVKITIPQVQCVWCQCFDIKVISQWDDTPQSAAKFEVRI